MVRQFVKRLVRVLSHQKYRHKRNTQQTRRNGISAHGCSKAPILQLVRDPGALRVVEYALPIPVNTLDAKANLIAVIIPPNATAPSAALQ